MSTQNITPILSCEYKDSPDDYRCKFWSKVIRVESSEQLPSDIKSSKDIAADYIYRNTDVEIFPGDFVISGEEVSHNKLRGWVYKLYATFIENDKLVLKRINFGPETKVSIRQSGEQNRDLLKGSGDLAAIMREICSIKRGIVEPILTENLCKQVNFLRNTTRLNKLDAKKIVIESQRSEQP